MADSTTHIDGIVQGQGAQDLVANAAFDALSPALTYGRRASSSSGLNFGYYGGKVRINGVSTSISNGSIALTASVTNYIEVNPDTGVVSKNNSAFTPGYIPLYSVVCGTSTVTSWTDHRGPTLLASMLQKTLTDANTTLTQAESENSVLAFTGTLTATRNIVLPLVGKRQWFVSNGTGQSLQLIGATGTGTTITAGSSGNVYSDGTNIGSLAASAGSAIVIKDEGTTLTSAPTSIDFVGTGIAATNTGGAVTVTVNTPTAITVKDEGTTLTSALASVDFTGAGVTATNTGGAVTVNIPGSGAAAVTIKDEGTSLTTSLTSMNFVGAGVTATNSGSDVTITVASGRDMLSANRTYYVRTDGSDSNNGLANTSGGAFLTIQKAIDVISSTLDLGIYDVTVNVNDGTRTAAVTLKQFISGGGMVYLVGNSATPANCVISTTSANCFTTADYAGPYSLDGFKLVTTTSGTSLSIAGLSSSVLFKNIDFGAAASAQISVSNGATCQASGNYSITGAAPWHYGAFASGIITVSSRTVTITGTPAFSSAFCLAQTTGIVVANGNTYSGTATGVRYNISLNAIANTAGGGANYFPGGSAGTTATGGQYA